MSDFGSFLMLRLLSERLESFKAALQEFPPETYGGVLEALASNNQIVEVEGNSWGEDKSICMLYFNSRQNAKLWYNSVIHQQNEQMGVTDAIVEDLVAFPPDDKAAFSLALVSLTDERRFFTEYCAAFGQSFLDAGGKVGATGDKVTREWESLQGDWIHQNCFILVNFLPDLPAAKAFFFSEQYRQAQLMRKDYSTVDIFIFERFINKT